MTGFPKTIMLEVTNHCNQRCVFCFNQHMKRKRGYIDESLAFRVMNEAYDAGARKIELYSTGEPLLHPSFSRLVRHAYALGYEYICTGTNGVLLTHDKTDALVDAGIDSVKVSINAATRETYLKVHGTDDFNRVMRNIEYAACKIPYFMASYIICPGNIHEVRLARKLLTPYCGKPMFSVAVKQGIYQSGELPVGYKKIPCAMVSERIHVTWEGYYTACCVDFEASHIVADLIQVSVKDAWESKAASNIRHAHLTGDVSGTSCAGCVG